MNFSKFSKNKLEREQMLAVKGGECPRGEDGHQHCITKLRYGLCYESIGESIPPKTPGGEWGWKDLGGQFLMC